MKKVYTKPELEILVLENQDIIVMSGPVNQFGNPDKGEAGDFAFRWNEL